ncbi:MAG TPA: ribose 5-phosphate isomerase B [Candidatus Polarisedimenticolia bacterium]|jgi:ribose 5-phosphate isomerase B|nr:ribose 5-phosphate isomerase B [Candidatus Polarisedimenticolia bacterium]
MAVASSKRPRRPRVALGCDHAGFHLKKALLSCLGEKRYPLVDVGTRNTRPVDYPDYTFRLCRALLDGRADVGVMICGSGAGACIAANKVKGIRAALCHDHYTAHQAVEHDDANVLCLGARVIGESLARELVEAFVEARFSGEPRHRRRLEKVLAMERGGKP